MLKARTGEYVSFLNMARHTTLLTDPVARQEWIQARREAISAGGRKVRSDKGKNHNKDRKNVDLLTFMIWMQLVKTLAAIEDLESKRFPRTA